MYGFLFVFVGTIVCFSNIFYVSRFYNENSVYPESQTRHYGLYMLWAYDYTFGNIPLATPEDVNLRWIMIFQFIYSFIYGVIMVNLLIALVNNYWEECQHNHKQRAFENLIKVQLMSEYMEV